MEEKQLYRPILKKAWQITRKFKSLWFLGLFAAIFSGGGEFEILSRIIFNPVNDQGVMKEFMASFKSGLNDSLQAGGDLWTNFFNSLTTSPINLLSAILILVLAIIIALFFIWLSIVSQVGLIRNINLINQGKKTTINEGIDAGVEKFWPVLSVQVVYKIILLIIFILLGKELLLLVALKTAGTVIHIIALVLFSLIILITSFIVRYQIFYIVLTKEKIMASLKSAWNLFTSNWLISLEMAFILFIVYLVAAYITAFATALFLAIPLALATYSQQIPMIFILLIGATAILAIFIITFLITALVNVFQWSSWTLLFDKISAGKTLGKIVKLSESSPNLSQIFRKK